MTNAPHTILTLFLTMMSFRCTLLLSQRVMRLRSDLVESGRGESIELC